ncbi:MAG: hypothetical protein ACRYFS_24520 [Janthinobacterium lividum]
MRIFWTYHGRIRAVQRCIPILHWLPDNARLTNEFTNTVTGNPWREEHQMLVREYKFLLPREEGGQCGECYLVLASELGERTSGVVMTAYWERAQGRHNQRYLVRPKRSHRKKPDFWEDDDDC